MLAIASMDLRPWDRCLQQRLLALGQNPVPEAGGGAMPDTEHIDEEVMDFVRKNEESAIEAARSWAKSVRESVPVEMPGVSELVNGVLDFTKEVLKIQREFIQNVMTETRRMVKQMAESTPEKAAPATKTPAHRTTKATKTAA